MTIIVALNTDRGTIVGYNDGWELAGTPVAGTAIPWIFFGDWALGITGESSVQRLLAYKLRDYSGNDDPFALISAIGDLLVDNYVGSKSDNEYVTTYGIYSILAHKDGRIWDVSGCLSLAEIPKGVVWAQGSGADYAIGACYAIDSLNQGISEERKLTLCIEAAIKSDVHCVGTAKLKNWA